MCSIRGTSLGIYVLLCDLSISDARVKDVKGLVPFFGAFSRFFSPQTGGNVGQVSMARGRTRTSHIVHSDGTTRTLSGSRQSCEAQRLYTVASVALMSLTKYSTYKP